jgi:hypothetical protein
MYFLYFSDIFAKKLHYIKVLQPPYLAAGHTKYQHQHIGIPDTHIMWLILSIFLMTDERESSTFYTLSGYFGHKLHYIKVLQPPKKWTQEKQNINTHTVAFQTQIMWLLLNNFSLIDERDSSTFYTFQTFWP